MTHPHQPLTVDLGDGLTATLESREPVAWLASNALGVELYDYVFTDSDRYALADALADEIIPSS